MALRPSHSTRNAGVPEIGVNCLNATTYMYILTDVRILGMDTAVPAQSRASLTPTEEASEKYTEPHRTNCTMTTQ